MDDEAFNNLIDAMSREIFSEVVEKCEAKGIQYPPSWCKTNLNDDGTISIEAYSDKEIRIVFDEQG